jgi:type IV pilus assembly protein PilB
MAGRRKLGELLVGLGYVPSDQVKAGLSMQKRNGKRIGETLVEMGHATWMQVSKALAKQFSLPFVDLTKSKPATAVIESVPADIAITYSVLPVKRTANGVILAVADPTNMAVVDQLRFDLGTEIQLAMAAPDALAATIQACYGAGGSAAGAAPSADEAAALEGDDDAPIIRLVTQIIGSAVKARASDIHLEPMQDRLRIRYRIDGILREVAPPDQRLQATIVSRIKIMANMDIAEKRLPQDGRIHIKVGGRALDLRVSSLPASHGETIVMRILDKEKGLVSLQKLGFIGSDHERFQRIIKRPNGIFLVTGPTGSGKTTTLYAALQALNRPDVKIITAEEPVEYNISGINQVQVRRRIGLTFARVLRAMLRQAPNVLLVGEIRDQETADIAIQAALTGHLVFSRHGGEALPRGLGAAGGHGAAARAQAVRRLPPAVSAAGVGAAGHRAAAAGRRQAHHLQRGGLRALQRHRLQRPHGHLRTARDVAQDA